MVEKLDISQFVKAGVSLNPPSGYVNISDMYLYFIVSSSTIYRDWLKCASFPRPVIVTNDFGIKVNHNHFREHRKIYNLNSVREWVIDYRPNCYRRG